MAMAPSAPPALAPAPPPPLLVRERGYEESYTSSDDASSMDDSLKLNEPMPALLPRSPPPIPTAFGKRKKVRVREIPTAYPQELPPPISIPSPPPIPDDNESSPAPPRTPLTPLSPLMARVRSKRKTIMERIEGWWDLGLLDKRQTLFGGGGAAAAQKV